MPVVADKSRLETKLGSYRVGTAACLADPNLLPRVQGFRRGISSTMKALDRAGLKTLPPDDYLVDRKIDGEFSVLVVEGDEAVLVNPGGTVRVGLAFQAEAARRLAKRGSGRAVVAGELYFHREDGKRPRVHDVGRAARKPDSPDDLAALRFAVFDLLEIDGAEAPTEFPARRRLVEEIFAGGESIAPVESKRASDPKEIEAIFERWVEEEGGEGIVLRGETAGSFKAKPRRTLDLLVVGFSEGTDDRAGMLHDLLVAAMRPDGTIHLFGRIGGGFTDEARRAMLSDLKDRVVASDYAEVNSDRVAYETIRPGLVVEASVLDVVAESTRGATIDRMVLDWDETAATYRIVRRLPLASPISPQFVRVREDKGFRVEDVPATRIAEIVEIPALDRDARAMTLPKSETLRRKVATKTLKGSTLVRKLLLWKTNKEADGEFPAYALHLTDYSPTRAKPLQREIRVGDSLERMEELWAKLEAEYFVRGWKEA